MVSIAPGEVARVDFAVVCTATSAVIEIVTLGQRVEAVYQVAVDGSSPVAVAAGTPAYVSGMPAGKHTVSLTASAPCQVEFGSRSVILTVGTLIRDTVPVSFSVSCAGAPPTRIAFVRRVQPVDDTPVPASIYVAKADGSGATRLTDGENPAWSPDRRQIVFNRGRAMYLINADGTDERLLGEGWNPAWSPDGRRIVFNTGGGFNREDGIFVMNADGSARAQLIRHDFAHSRAFDWIGMAEWSPDGRRISFLRAPDENSWQPWAIYLMNADGSDPRRVEIDGSVAEVHAWSPDASRIVTGLGIGDIWSITSVDTSGRNRRVHFRAESNGYVGHPTWSPDGREIAFNKYVNPSSCEIPRCPMRIFVVSASGGPARQLVPDAAGNQAYWDEQPAW
jgi:TolB protein